MGIKNKIFALKKTTQYSQYLSFSHLWTWKTRSNEFWVFSKDSAPLVTHSQILSGQIFHLGDCCGCRNFLFFSFFKPTTKICTLLDYHFPCISQTLTNVKFPFPSVLVSKIYFVFTANGNVPPGGPPGEYECFTLHKISWS